MMDWTRSIFLTTFDHACQAALEQHKGENEYAKLSEKALAKVVADVMAAAASKKVHLGKAVVALLTKKRK